MNKYLSCMDNSFAQNGQDKIKVQEINYKKFDATEWKYSFVFLLGEKKSLRGLISNISRHSRFYYTPAFVEDKLFLNLITVLMSDCKIVLF